MLADANWSKGGHGARGTINLTQADGWRDRTGYDRQSATLRWDWLRGSACTKTLLSVNRIDQQTAGSSALSEIDYLFDASANLTPISFRAVDAVRLSVDHQRMIGQSSVSVVPYYRYDSMELLPNWTLTFDPTVDTTDNHSLGVLAKVRRDLTRWRASIVAGVDADWSPGGRVEDVIRAGTTASALPSRRPLFTSYALGARVYDYDVTFASASPYVQAELSPSPRVRVSAGLRADHMRYDYGDRLTTPATPRHRRPADGSRSFTHVSPKLGVTYAYGRHTYEDWIVDPAAGIDLSSFEQESAPRHFGSATLRVNPMARVTAAAEMSVIGGYWMDANNTTRYGGHTLLNLRGQVDVRAGVRAFVKALNVLDRLYAESASYTIARGRELAPGRPRTLFAGVELDWRK